MLSERAKMLSGKPYSPGDTELASMREVTAAALLKFNSTGCQKYLEEVFCEKFDELCINPPFHCDYLQNIKFGREVFVNYNCTFLPCNIIEIGDYTKLGPNVQIYTAIHPVDPDERRTKIETSKPVKIGADCWIGGGAVILPGVTIGDGTTIGAGSVVTKNIPPRTLAVGNPAKVIKTL